MDRMPKYWYILCFFAKSMPKDIKKRALALFLISRSLALGIYYAFCKSYAKDTKKRA
jgi:hypothetical protein